METGGAKDATKATTTTKSAGTAFPGK